MANAGHSGARWRALHAQLKAQGGPCWLCGQPIDRTLRYPHPMSFSADYVTPWSQGGTMRLTNLRPAHLQHNRERGAHTPTTVTSRDW